MALVSLAIVSHNRQEEEVMYIRDFSSNNAAGRMSSLDDFEYDLFHLPPRQNSHNNSHNSDETPVTTIATVRQEHPWDDCSLRHHFLLQAALEKLNDLLRGSVENLQAALDKINDGRRYNGLHRMSVCFLCCADDCRFYGFTTNTNLKIIIAIEDDILPNEVQLQKSKDEEVRVVLTRVHSLYVNYLLNPFSSTSGKITSRRFDRGIEGIVSEFNGPV